MTTRAFVYWTVYPNLHQRAWIDGLREAGCDVEVCYFGRYDTYRKAMGWREPATLPSQEHRVASLHEALEAIPDYAHRIVILTGYHDRIYREAVRHCERCGISWVLLAEGTQGRLRSLALRRWFGHRVNRSALWAFGLGSEAVGDLVHGWGIRPQKVSSLAYVTPNADQPTVPRPHEGFRFVFSGALIRRKGIDVLAQAWKHFAPEHPDCVLKIVGDGPCSNALEGLPRLERFGICPPENIHEALADCDCGILPSRFDGWGMALSEYARAGLTLIGTDACGASESLILPGHNGYIVSAEDVEALIQAMADVRYLKADAAPLLTTSATHCVQAFLACLETARPYQRPRRLLHVVAGCWANGGGLSELVAATALAQARQGNRVTLVFLGGQSEHPLVRECRQAGVTVQVFPRSRPHCLYMSRRLLTGLGRCVRRATFVHIYSCWTFPVWWTAFLARRLRIPYALAPQGCLDPVRRRYGAVRKAVAWMLFDRHVLAGAAWLQATADCEVQWLRDALGPRCPSIRVIPNGVDGALFDSVPEPPRTKTILFLGRLHPLKGLDLLTEAWRSAALGTDWELIVAGPRDGVELSSVPGMKVIGPLYGEAKARALKSAACLILPTRSENFGIVVAEALWCRTPVICTRGAPWPELGDFWVDISAEALADAIRRMVKLSPDAREERFSSLFALARERFSWDAIARKLAN